MPPTDRPAKIERLRQILADTGKRSIALTSAESLSWLLDGARVSVPFGGAPVLAAIVDAEGQLSLTGFANEVDRLRSEEVDLEVEAVPWFGSLVDPDADHLIEADALPALRAARAELLPLERARYVTFGSELAASVTAVLLEATPGMTERELAARLAHAVVSVGADPVVLLVAGHDRLRHRHPLPTTGALGARAMVVVGAKRHGLIINFTRWVAIDPSLSEVDIAVLEVEADAFAATRPGRSLADVLTDIAASYERHGLGPDEWRCHHQGGPTGYVGRDPRATPTAIDVVRPGQAWAWNPTAPAAKVEDTVLIDDGVVTVLSRDPAWPTTVVRGIPRPLPLPYGGN
jgi:Xaa-Pro aminopeptidase